MRTDVRTSCADGEPATLTGATLVRRWSEHPCATSAADEETDDTEESAKCADQADRSNDYDVESASYVQSNSGSPITVPGTADVASQRLLAGVPIGERRLARRGRAVEQHDPSVRPGLTPPRRSSFEPGTPAP